MKYRVTHTTTYDYADAVSVCHNEAYLTPRTFERQLCEYHRLVITPSPSNSGRRTDYFGNPLLYFSFNTGFESLNVKAVSRVQILNPPPDLELAKSPAWELVAKQLKEERTSEVLSAAQFRFDSPRVAASEKLADYGRKTFPPGQPIVEGVKQLAALIHQDFEFDPKATTVHTPVEEVLQNRKGVCQDFAHLQIGVLRSLGLAARYVSGYVRTFPPPGKPRMVGADASHAWVGVYCGDLGWIDVDPTNNKLVSTEHIALAWGRDYGDVCPVKGVYVGGGAHELTVSVDVMPLTGE